MRIVFVQAGIGAGGAEKIVNLLAHHRAERGDEVHVLALNSGGRDSYFPYNDSVCLEVRDANVTVPRRSYERALGHVAWLRRRLAALHPDLVVSFLTKVNVLTLLASTGLPARLIVSERNNPGRQDAHPLWQTAGHMLARRADALVMQTEEARNSLPQGLRAGAVVIPNPCTLPPGIRGNPGDGARIVAVGRLTRQKGFDLLLEAFAIVASLVPHASLTIFGDGPELGALKTQARRLGICEKVHFPGTSKMPGTWLEAADVFVLSSRYEGFANVLVEALAAGLPAIAFDCPWSPGAILSEGKGGILVPPEDVEELAHAIARALSDPHLRARLAREAAQTISRFSLPSVLQKWDEVIVRPGLL